MNKLLLLFKILTSFSEESFIDDFLEMDDEVIDCEFDLYMLMMFDEEDIRAEQLYQNFKNKYAKLTEIKKEKVKNDYLRIINNQEKNKVKGKRK